MKGQQLNVTCQEHSEAAVAIDEAQQDLMQRKLCLKCLATGYKKKVILIKESIHQIQETKDLLKVDRQNQLQNNIEILNVFITNIEQLKNFYCEQIQQIVQIAKKWMSSIQNLEEDFITKIQSQDEKDIQMFLIFVTKQQDILLNGIPKFQMEIQNLLLSVQQTNLMKDCQNTLLSVNPITSIFGDSKFFVSQVNDDVQLNQYCEEHENKRISLLNLSQEIINQKRIACRFCLDNYPSLNYKTINFAYSQWKQINKIREEKMKLNLEMLNQKLEQIQKQILQRNYYFNDLKITKLCVNFFLNDIKFHILGIEYELRLDLNPIIWVQSTKLIIVLGFLFTYILIKIIEFYYINYIFKFNYVHKFGMTLTSYQACEEIQRSITQEKHQNLQIKYLAQIIKNLFQIYIKIQLLKPKEFKLSNFISNFESFFKNFKILQLTQNVFSFYEIETGDKSLIKISLWGFHINAILLKFEQFIENAFFFYTIQQLQTSCNQALESALQKLNANQQQYLQQVDLQQQKMNVQWQNLSKEELIIIAEDLSRINQQSFTDDPLQNEFINQNKLVDQTLKETIKMLQEYLVTQIHQLNHIIYYDVNNQLPQSEKSNKSEISDESLISKFLQE